MHFYGFIYKLLYYRSLPCPANVKGTKLRPPCTHINYISVDIMSKIILFADGSAIYIRIECIQEASTGRYVKAPTSKTGPLNGKCNSY